MDDAQAMALALEEARHSLQHGDVPVGALVLRGDEVLACRHNERELHHDPSAHAELLALVDAARRLDSWRLEDCTVVVTLEPCLMCAGALINARVRRLVFGAFDPKAGACGSLYNVCVDPRLNHEVEVASGIEQDACAALLTEFFAARRA